jgi:hypothetical protein
MVEGRLAHQGGQELLVVEMRNLNLHARVRLCGRGVKKCMVRERIGKN